MFKGLARVRELRRNRVGALAAQVLGLIGMAAMPAGSRREDLGPLPRLTPVPANRAARRGHAFDGRGRKGGLRHVPPSQRAMARFAR